MKFFKAKGNAINTNTKCRQVQMQALNINTKTASKERKPPVFSLML